MYNISLLDLIIYEIFMNLGWWLFTATAIVVDLEMAAAERKRKWRQQKAEAEVKATLKTAQV